MANHPQTAIPNPVMSWVAHLRRKPDTAAGFQALDGRKNLRWCTGISCVRPAPKASATPRIRILAPPNALSVRIGRAL
jgi:hypothetical protein